MKKTGAFRTSAGSRSERWGRLSHVYYLASSSSSAMMVCHLQQLSVLRNRLLCANNAVSQKREAGGDRDFVGEMGKTRASWQKKCASSLASCRIKCVVLAVKKKNKQIRCHHDELCIFSFICYLARADFEWHNGGYLLCSWQIGGDMVDVFVWWECVYFIFSFYLNDTLFWFWKSEYLKILKNVDGIPLGKWWCLLCHKNGKNKMIKSLENQSSLSFAFLAVCEKSLLILNIWSIVCSKLIYFEVFKPHLK